MEVSMDSRKFVLQKAGVIALGQVVCVAAMIGVFALLGQFDMTVLWGGIVGGVMATLNFFFMAIGAMMAADKAMEENVTAGTATVRMSYILRLAVLAIVLFAFAKSGICNVVALVVPLVFTRPILTITEFFRKPGEKKA
jgi:hypothetical protein